MTLSPEAAVISSLIIAIIIVVFLIIFCLIIVGGCISQQLEFACHQKLYLLEGCGQPHFWWPNLCFPYCEKPLSLFISRLFVISISDIIY